MHGRADMRNKLLITLLLPAVLVFSGPAAQAQVSLGTDAQEMLDMAEELFGSVFSSGTPLREAQGFIYRYYPVSETYLGFRDGSVFTYGGPFGKKLKNFGSISQVKLSLENYRAKLELDLGDIDTGGVDITGNYTMTISGSYSTVIAGFESPPFGIDMVIENVPAADVNDTNQIDELLTRIMDNVTEVEDLKVVVTNNMESRITFTVSATVTQAGVTTVLDVEFDLVRQ